RSIPQTRPVGTRPPESARSRVRHGGYHPDYARAPAYRRGTQGAWQQAHGAADAGRYGDPERRRHMGMVRQRCRLCGHSAGRWRAIDAERGDRRPAFGCRARKCCDPSRGRARRESVKGSGTEADTRASATCQRGAAEGDVLMHNPWTDTLIARLRTLWVEGHSTAEIGRRLGVSRNGVIGKAHRLHLAARRSPIKRQSPPKEFVPPPGSIPRVRAPDDRRFSAEEDAVILRYL